MESLSRDSVCTVSKKRAQGPILSRTSAFRLLSACMQLLWPEEVIDESVKFVKFASGF